MYQEHPLFEAPAASMTLWRYMDLSKLIALLHKKCLFFARADRLGDPWEGATSYANIAVRQVLGAQSGLEYQQLSLPYSASRKHTYISCWHENPHESAAMWKLYLSSNEGIAIQTTFERLKDSFHRDNQNIYIGRLHYYDPDLEVLPEGNLLRQYLHKRKSFEHEREVRALIQDYPGLSIDKPASEYGLNIDIDIDLLIEKVYVAPTSPAWSAQVVQAVLDRFEVHRDVVHSSLDDDPVF